MIKLLRIYREYQSINLKHETQIFSEGNYTS